MGVTTTCRQDAGYLFSGVRPSSGAAGLSAGETWQISCAFGVETLLLPRTAALRTLNRYDAGSTLGVTVKPPLNKYPLRRGVPHPPTQHRAEQEFGAPFARTAQEASQRRLTSAADSERQARMGIAALLCCLLFTACSKETSASKASSIEPSPQAEAAQQSPDPDVSAKAAQSTELRQTVEDAKKMLTGGSYDEAAARLLKMQINGARFSDKDAAAYRETLQEAYSRALEAAGNGDPKGKAALEMIRAARGR